MTTPTTAITIEGSYALPAGSTLSFYDSDAYFLPLDQMAPDTVDIVGNLVVQGDNSATIHAFYLGGGLYYTGTVALEATSTIRVANSGSGDAIGYQGDDIGPALTNSATFIVSDTGTGSAIGFWDANAKNDISNYGSLIVNAVTGAARGVLSNNGESLVNTGTVSATSAKSDAVAVQFGNKSTINNSGTITAVTSSPGHASTAVETSAGDLLVTNYGTISAMTALSVDNSLYLHSNITVYNFGTLSGDINVGQGYYFIQNTGKLTGNIYLGSYPGTVDFSKGAFSGQLYIDPSHSTFALNDTITLGGGGVVTLGGGDANVHISLTGSATPGVITTLNMAGSIRDATFTMNADGSTLVSSTTSGSATLVNVTTVAFADGVINVGSSVVAEPYKLFMGRDPTGAEVTYWSGRLAAGGHVQDIVAAILADPTGQAYTASQITAEYQTWFGRIPTGSENSVWDKLFVQGAGYADLRSALVSAPEGQSHTAAALTGLYDTYLGRDPSASDIAYWQSKIVAGESFGDVRIGLVNDISGLVHTARTIDALYQSFMGREDNSAEASTWQSLIQGGNTFGDARSAILGSNEGQVHTAATVTSLYDAYFGRDPSASELNVWQSLIAGGADFGTTRAALLADPAGVAHTTATVTSFYDTYFGRDPSAAEVGVWTGLISGGDDFYQLQDTLERQSTAASIQHVTVAPGGQVFTSGTGPNLIVDGFDPNGNAVVLSAAQFGHINPLDAAHAHQVAALDGTFDVLVNLDATHSVLFEHTFLNYLHASDFIFT